MSWEISICKTGKETEEYCQDRYRRKIDCLDVRYVKKIGYEDGKWMGLFEEHIGISIIW
jgi:hypothetical protein